MLPSSSNPSQIAPVQAAPVQTAGGNSPPLDQLEQDVKALQQQTLHFQSSLAQLESLEQTSPHFNALAHQPLMLAGEGVLLGAGALFLGCLLGWYGLKRFASAPLQALPPAEVPDFEDSRLYLQEMELAEDLVLEEASDPSGDTLPETAPVSEPVSQARHGTDSSPFAPPATSADFDSQAAASEVERVRKYLAEKRATRTRQFVHSGESHAEEPRQEVRKSEPPHVLLTTAEVDSSDKVEEIDIGISEPLESLAVVQVQEPVEVGTPEPEPEPDFAVRLALAQEFLALGLLDGAREIAQEVLQASDALLHPQVQALLQEIDRQEQTQQSESAWEAALQSPPDAWASAATSE